MEMRYDKCKEEKYMNKVFIAILLATALAAIEGTIVATAIPSITADLQGVALMSWIYSAYLLTSAIAAILFGKLADLFGRKKMILIGITLFTVGSLLCGTAQSIEALIIFRAIQGIGAGSILPITLTIVSELFPQEKARAKGQSYISMVWGVAGIVAPLLGGLLIGLFSWHAVFLVNIPFALISMYLIWKHYDETVQAKTHQIDYIGAALFTVATLAFMYAIITGSNAGQWTTPSQMTSYFIAVIGYITFVFVELKAKEPIIPLTFFKNRRFMTINVLSFCTMAIVIGMSAYVPLYAQTALGQSATVGGLLLTPLSLFWTFGAMLISMLIGKMTNKYLMLLGTMLLIVGTLLMTQFQADTSLAYVAICSGIVGLGMGFISPLLIITLQQTVAPVQVGTATGFNSFTNTFSQALGAALYGVLFNIALHTEAAGAFVSGIRAVYMLAVAFAIIAFICVCTIRPKK